MAVPYGGCRLAEVVAKILDLTYQEAAQKGSIEYDLAGLQTTTGVRADIAEFAHSPPVRNGANFRVLESCRKKFV